MAQKYSLGTIALMALLAIRLFMFISLLNYGVTPLMIIVIAAYAGALAGVAKRKIYGVFLVYGIVMVELLFASSLGTSGELGAKAAAFIMLLLASSESKNIAPAPSSPQPVKRKK